MIKVTKYGVGAVSRVGVQANTSVANLCKVSWVMDQHNLGNLPFVSETLKPLPCFLVIHLSTFFLHLGLLCDLDESLLRTIANVPATADKELSARLKQIDDLFSVMVQAVLNVLATFGLFGGA